MAWFFATPLAARVLAAGVVVAGVIAAALLLDLLPSVALPGDVCKPHSRTLANHHLRHRRRLRQAVPVVTAAVADIGYPTRSIEFGGSICLGDPFHPISCPSPGGSGATFLAGAEVTFWGSPLHAFFNLFEQPNGFIVYDRNVLPEPGSTAPPETPSSTATASPKMRPRLLASPRTRRHRPVQSWTSISWTRLDPADTLSLVRRVIPWSEGYIALGGTPPDAAEVRTQVWVSSDGAEWRALDRGVFGDSTIVVGVAQVGDTLVALTASASPTCIGEDSSCTDVFGPIGSWTSSDALHWTWHPGPPFAPTRSGRDDVPSRAPLLVAGPTALLAASGNGPFPTPDPPDLLLASSTDGVTWQSIAPTGLPSGFAIGGLWGRSDGYVMVGTYPVDAIGHDAGAALWSADGTHWSRADAGPVLAMGGVRLASSGPTWGLTSAEFGRDGAIAVGGPFGAPAPTLWWQTSDGRHWQDLQDYPALGPTLGEGEGAGGAPNGALASDGTRFVELRIGSDPRAFVSFDGSSWQSVTMGGALPTEPPHGSGEDVVTVLPGGVLFSDPTGITWYGAASPGS